jgi:AAA+ superfamily predicted ATPase
MELQRVLDSVRRAVEHLPDDDVLRAHLAALLIRAGLTDEAVGHVGRLLASDPGNRDYQALMAAAISASGAPEPGEESFPSAPAPGVAPGSGWGTGGRAPSGGRGPGGGSAPSGGRELDGFDWGAAEEDLVGGMSHEPVTTRVRLADVGGLAEVKAQIDAVFLTPLRNPELRARYGASLRGGMLLYGPPGCGKTYLARAIAGELGARFITVSLAEVLSRWVGQSEANVAELFAYARAQSPCVVFLDEVDALGRSRSGLGRSGAALRGVVNQLLAELDGVATQNEGVFVLGATNAPWDVDLALRRPGRFDRLLFVGPPDLPARRQILATHLADLPVAAGLDLDRLAQRAEAFSGADLALACRTAAQSALAEAARTADASRPISAGDLDAAVAGVTPSTRRWFESARNVVLFADSAGEFAPLAEHMSRHGML